MCQQDQIPLILNARHFQQLIEGTNSLIASLSISEDWDILIILLFTVFLPDSFCVCFTECKVRKSANTTAGLHCDPDLGSQSGRPARRSDVQFPKFKVQFFFCSTASGKKSAILCRKSWRSFRDCWVQITQKPYQFRDRMRRCSMVKIKSRGWAGWRQFGSSHCTFWQQGSGRSRLTVSRTVWTHLMRQMERFKTLLFTWYPSLYASCEFISPQRVRKLVSKTSHPFGPLLLQLINDIFIH